MIQKDLSIAIEELKKDASVQEIAKCYPVMQHLRPHLTEQAFIAQVQRQFTQGYRMVALSEGDQVRAVSGFRIHEFLAWGNVLYVDDLVTDVNQRGKGFGSKLLNWLIALAKESKCDQFHLDSGHHRYDAHRLYLNHGLKIQCHHFILELNPK